MSSTAERRVGGEVGDEAVDVVCAVALVEPVPLQHEPLARARTGRRSRAPRWAAAPSRPRGRSAQARGYGAQARHAAAEVGRGLDQPQGQRLALGDGAGERRRLAGEHLRAPTMSEKSGAKGGLHRRGEDALEGVRERAGGHGLAVREARILADVKVYVFPSLETTGSASASSARRCGPSGGTRPSG